MMRCTECRDHYPRHKLSCSQSSVQRIELPVTVDPPDHLAVLGFTGLGRYVVGPTGLGRAPDGTEHADRGFACSHESAAALWKRAAKAYREAAKDWEHIAKHGR